MAKSLSTLIPILVTSFNGIDTPIGYWWQTALFKRDLLCRNKAIQTEKGVDNKAKRTTVQNTMNRFSI